MAARDRSVSSLMPPSQPSSPQNSADASGLSAKSPASYGGRMSPSASYSQQHRGSFAQALHRDSTSGQSPAILCRTANDMMEELPAHGSSFRDDRSLYASSTTSQAIRDSTTRLASMSYSNRPRTFSTFSSENSHPARRPSGGQQALANSVTDHRPVHLNHLGPTVVEEANEPDQPSFSQNAQTNARSGLSLMLERDNMERLTQNVAPEIHQMPSTQHIGSGDEELAVESLHERTPLLSTNQHSSNLKTPTGNLVKRALFEPIQALPSVVLGLLLNVLDGVSYGMILFPATPVFAGYSSLGVSLFFMSCIVSQLVFSLGGSVFPGGNGSMMIEAIPFFHILAATFTQVIGDDPEAIVATTMMAFAFSSILTGLVFFSLGAFKLGILVGYFPRHILVGCIGGVGVFLIETGLQVSRGVEKGFEYNLATLHIFFQSRHAIALWTLPLALAVLLRLITHTFHHQLIFPAYFFAIFLIFYLVVAVGGWDMDQLRQTGWILDVGADVLPWYKVYTLFNFRKTHWEAFWAAMPTQLALVFFGILHVPLNVPALGVSLHKDNVQLDRELLAHGAANVLAGLVGTVPNYLTYVNTLLFYRVGGGSRLSGVMLAIATSIVMMVGPTVMATLPVMVVGALIFALGIDLVTEAVWDTRHRVNRMEYATIWVITIGMTIFDFVVGLLLGIVLACVFFVLTSSRRRAVRAVLSGATAVSTVRRPRWQKDFIQQVGSQTLVMKLEGFLFFGTITAVEAEVRKLLDLAEWQHHPIRFLVVDFALVHGLDFSAAEAFVRVERLLAAKDVLLILCGAEPESALRGVGLWGDRESDRVKVFDLLNDALEWTENAYLTAFFEIQECMQRQTTKIDYPKVDKPPFSLTEGFQNSPRRCHLVRAGGDAMPQGRHTPSSSNEHVLEPASVLLQTLGAYSDVAMSPDFCQALVSYFVKRRVVAGDVVWVQDEPADGMYVIEAGCLRATYVYSGCASWIQETMVAGTIAGDLSTLSETARNCTVVAERDSVLWKLSHEGLERMEKEQPEVARQFTKIVLKAVVEEQDVLSSHLIAVLS
nr:vacuolar protein [Cryptococcus depauperatus CBS 7855]